MSERHSMEFTFVSRPTEIIWNTREGGGLKCHSNI